MEKKTWDEKVEAAAERFERRVESAAGKMEQELNHRWRRKTFRRAVKGVSAAAELGMIAGAMALAGRGHRGWAVCCFALGAAGLAADAVCLLLEKNTSR